MLQLSSISKSYTTADFTQKALDEVSIAFRDNEFVAILGPSGSGKTTMLNIVGGLDQYDSGDLIIDSVSTRQYRDRDWDTYRNNRIGFVFQSYNLIPHQTILANVELALTLSGVSRSERRARATAALKEVGLGEHIHKRPSQLSGGQMQRVAIARALINDPEIVLADEPTGALDSTTSIQIMNLLTEIAADRLVIMVTHNPELAEEYANRVVNLRDGRVVSDTNPFDPLIDSVPEDDKPIRRTSMSFLTAVALSFNNLMTKKGRTLMTSFAGSIGIMGIAAILALATGVNDYVRSIEEDTLSVYPLTITSQGFDMTAMIAMSTEFADDSAGDAAGDGSVHQIQAMNQMFSAVATNDLAALKEYLDSDGGSINDHVKSIEYAYGTTPQIFSVDGSGGIRQVNPDTTFSALGFGSDSSMNSMMAAQMSTNVFDQLVSDTEIIESQYDVVAGRWPARADEVVLVLTGNGGVSDFILYAMGLRDPAELDSMVQQMVSEQEIVTPNDTRTYTYDELMGVSFKVVNAADYFVFDPTYDVWTDRSGDAEHLARIVEAGTDLHVSGILQPNGSTTATALTPGLYYTPELTSRLIDEAGQTEIVRAQLADPSLNVFSGRTFADEAENPQGGAFDLGSLITVDSDAIQAAFAFDQSALTMDLSGLSLDFSGLNLDASLLDASAMGVDLSNIAIDLSGMEVDAGSMPQLDVMQILAQLEFGLDDVNTELAQDVAAGIVEGYLAFAEEGDLDVTDVVTSFPLFLESDAGRALVDQAQGIIDLDDISAQLQDIMSDYVQQSMNALVGQLSGQIGDQLEAQIGSALRSQLGAAMQAEIASVLETQVSRAMTSAMNELASNMSRAMSIDEAAFMDAFQFKMDEEDLTALLTSLMTSRQTSLDSNLARLGYADPANPFSIDIYPTDFESKEQVITILDDYNARMESTGRDESIITYTDIVGTLMSSVTTIINVVSYVLVAFVSISLVVSSIMIGVITYISVLERRKEIGVLRSIGASKRDIRRVFNAETLIVGFVAGLVGIVVVGLLTLPVNAIVESRFGIAGVAQLPWEAAVILVAISMGLTFLSGLIPSSAAARKDPVEALRSE